MSSAPAFLYSGGIKGLKAIISPRYQDRDLIHSGINVVYGESSNSDVGSTDDTRYRNRSGGTASVNEIGGLDDRPSRPDPNHPNVRAYCSYLLNEHREIAASAGVKRADILYR